MRRRTLPLVALLVIALSGCFKINLDIEVEEDGSGSIGGLIALDTEAATRLASLFEDEGTPAPTRDELCEEFLTDTDVPEGSTTEPYEDGKFCGIRFSQDFAAGELEQALAESLAADDTGDFDIRRDGDGWRFDATFTDDAAGDAEFFPSELFSDAEFVVKVKLPGRQVEHNADSIDADGAMIWNIDLFDPGPPLMARTEPGTPITGSGGDGDGGSSIAVIIVGILVVLALAAVGYWWWRKKSAGGDGPTGPAAQVDPALAGTVSPVGPPPPPGATQAPPPPPPPPSDPPPPS